MDAQPRLLQPTALLDFTNPAIEAVVQERGWRQLPTFERIGAVYDFVRNEIAFGYNAGDELPASAVMADGIGQCNTKATLLMALMRAVGIACRFHGFTIDKPLQKGAITGLAYVLIYGGMARLATSRTALLQFVYPGATLVCDALVYDRWLAPAQMAGVALMGLALWWGAHEPPRSGAARVAG